MRARRARPDPPGRVDLLLSAVGAAAILAQDPRPPEVAYYLLDFGRRTVFARLTLTRKRPPGRQPDVVCLSIAAEPSRAIAVLGADLPLPDRAP